MFYGYNGSIVGGPEKFNRGQSFLSTVLARLIHCVQIDGRED
jgi:hypothetical protein